MSQKTRSLHLQVSQDFTANHSHDLRGTRELLRTGTADARWVHSPDGGGSETVEPETSEHFMLMKTLSGRRKNCYSHRVCQWRNIL